MIKDKERKIGKQNCTKISQSLLPLWSKFLTLKESDWIDFLVFLSDLKHINACKKDSSHKSTYLVVPSTALLFFSILLFSELKDLMHNFL